MNEIELNLIESTRDMIRLTKKINSMQTNNQKFNTLKQQLNEKVQQIETLQNTINSEEQQMQKMESKLLELRNKNSNNSTISSLMQTKHQSEQLIAQLKSKLHWLKGDMKLQMYSLFSLIRDLKDENMK